MVMPSTSEVDYDPDLLIAAARTAIDDARHRANEAVQIVEAVIGGCAYALREQGFSDRRIAAEFGVSRNRLDKLVSRGMGVIAAFNLADGFNDAHEDRWRSRWIGDILTSVADRGPSPWRQAPYLLSSDLMEANGIAIPESIRGRNLDTSAAQFDNTTTGERVLVYTMHRWNGTRLINSVTGRVAGADGRGVYRIELRAPNGARCELSPEFLGLDHSALFFGTGWDEPERRRTDTEAFEIAQAAIRRHYRVWPAWPSW